jgi:hypothetical protein
MSHLSTTTFITTTPRYAYRFTHLSFLSIEISLRTMPRRSINALFEKEKKLKSGPGQAIRNTGTRNRIGIVFFSEVSALHGGPAFRWMVVPGPFMIPVRRMYSRGVSRRMLYWRV